MNITRGKVARAQKIVLYGPEGIGKSTFAAQFPDPVFIDTEGSTGQMDVRRFDAPTSWAMLRQQVDYIKQHPDLCRTLVLDTADWAESLCAAEVCAKNNVAGIEDFGYGKGYTYLSESFGSLLNQLAELTGLGINLCVTAHAKMRKFEQPDELGAYDRWELKLSKQVGPMLKEWADAVLFANYKTTVITTKEGAKKGTGGKRVLYTCHHPCWDAKNRYGLPEEMPFEFGGIARYIPVADGHVTKSRETALSPEPPADTTETPDQTPPATPQTPPAPPEAPTAAPPQTPPQGAPEADRPDLDGVPKEVADLCIASGVTEDQVRKVVASKGYYPEDTKISDYDPQFVQGWLLQFWNKCVEMILEDDLPF